MYARNTSDTKLKGLTPNEMRDKVHTTPGAVEGLVPMGAALPKDGDNKLFSLSAAPQYDLSSRLKDAFRNKESVVGIEHKGRRYTVKCVRVMGGTDALKKDVEEAFLKGDKTVIGVEQAGKGYRVEITPLGQTVGGVVKRGRGRPFGSKTRKHKAQ